MQWVPHLARPTAFICTCMFRSCVLSGGAPLKVDLPTQKDQQPPKAVPNLVVVMIYHAKAGNHCLRPPDNSLQEPIKQLKLDSYPVSELAGSSGLTCFDPASLGG